MCPAALCCQYTICSFTFQLLHTRTVHTLRVQVEIVYSISVQRDNVTISPAFCGPCGSSTHEPTGKFYIILILKSTPATMMCNEKRVVLLAGITRGFHRRLHRYRIVGGTSTGVLISQGYGLEAEFPVSIPKSSVRPSPVSSCNWRTILCELYILKTSFSNMYNHISCTENTHQDMGIHLSSFKEREKT